MKCFNYFQKERGEKPIGKSQFSNNRLNGFQMHLLEICLNFCQQELTKTNVIQLDECLKMTLVFSAENHCFFVLDSHIEFF